jgi:hypothetical protein
MFRNGLSSVIEFFQSDLFMVDLLARTSNQIFPSYKKKWPLINLKHNEFLCANPTKQHSVCDSVFFSLPTCLWLNGTTFNQTREAALVKSINFRSDQRVVARILCQTQFRCWSPASQKKNVHCPRAPYFTKLCYWNSFIDQNQNFWRKWKHAQLWQQCYKTWYELSMKKKNAEMTLSDWQTWQTYPSIWFADNTQAANGL